MARYYGKLQGSRGPATRLGGAGSGLTVTAASWNGAVRVRLFEHHESKEDWCCIELTTWNGAGRDAVLYTGPVSKLHRLGLTEHGKRAVHSRSR